MNRQIAMHVTQYVVIQGDPRIDSSSSSALIVLCLNNQISVKMHVRILRPLYRVKSLRYRSLPFQKAHIYFITYGSLVTKATKV